MDHHNNNNCGSSNSISTEEEEIKPNFRIRLTIRNSSSSSPTPSEVLARSSCHENLCDHQHCELAAHRCNHQVDKINNSTPISDQPKKKAFQIVEPQNHKSSLFVNLSETRRNTLEQKNCGEKSLFISPDLNQITPVTPSESANSTICSSVSSTFDLTTNYTSPSSSIPSSEEDLSIASSNMSQACNLFNRMMLASPNPSRSRSASVTPAPNTSAEDDPEAANSRRASSSNNLAARTPTGMEKSSNETLCDQTQKNSVYDGSYVQHSDMMQPLQVHINEPIRQLDYPLPMNTNHPISLDDIQQIDLDYSRLEDECNTLQKQVQLWEQRVEELEWQSFGKDVPRTLKENVIHQRKKLRELEIQIYTLNLKAEDDERFGKERTLPSPDRSNLYIPHKEQGRNRDRNLYPPLEEDRRPTSFASSPIGGNKPPTSKIGSRLRPGQENTADILDAVPPISSLQYKQYLNRASSGTDTSGYSHLPTYDRYRLQTVGEGGHSHALPSSDDSGSHSTDNQNVQVNRISSEQRNQRHHQQHGQFDDGVVELAQEAPIRPNHFKPILRSNRDMTSQESSLTSSSASPL